MKTEPLKIMAAGHICLDITPVFSPDTRESFENLLSPGKLINVGRAILSTGGSVANTGLAMARLGADVFLNGKIGDDEVGKIIKAMVGPHRAQSLRTIHGQDSSYSIVLAIPGIDRIFLHNPGANDTFSSEDINYEALKDCRLFHFGYPTLMKKFYENQGRELVGMFQRAREYGAVTSLDVTLPDPQSDSGQVDWRKILRDVLPFVDIFLPSIEEITFMLDRSLFERRKSQAGQNDPVLFYTASDCSEISEQIISMGTSVVVLKKGIRGCYLKTADAPRLEQVGHCLPLSPDAWAQRELWAASYKADEFGSATGAGDATIAGFLTAFLEGLDPVESLKVANMIGWQNIRTVDAVSGIEDWPTTLQMVNDKKRRFNPVQIKDSSWRFHSQEGILCGPADRSHK
jgi:sugar/nucleoside kinase (ribokinase family)